jgi:hypothetical protein
VGGDEFVVFAGSVVDEFAAAALAQRLVAAISQDTLVRGGDLVSIAASAGVTIWGTRVTFDQAVEDADALMYEAKRIGGGIAMQDPTGRILVRDPYGLNAVPEEIERGRHPVRVQAVNDLVEGSRWGAHVLLRGELCTVNVSQTLSLVADAVVTVISQGEPRRLIVEPRGRGWAREGLLLDVVTQLAQRYPETELLVMVDTQPGSSGVRLAADEVRARLGVGVVLGGIGSPSGGDFRLMAQSAPAMLALDHEVVLNLERSQPPGVAVTLAAAVAVALGVPLLIVHPPAHLDVTRLVAWGASLALTAADTDESDERHP